MLKHLFAKTGTIPSLLLAVASAADAQVISIKEGTFVIDDARNSTITLTGTQGFRFDGSVSLGSASYEAIEQCWVPECPPGTVVDLSDSWGGGDVFGLVQFRGKTHDDIGGLNSDAAFFIALSASVTMPPLRAGPVTVSVPFAFASVFSFGLNGRRPRSVPVTGGGTATLTLVPLAEDPSNWHIQRIEFEFTSADRRPE